MLIGCECLHYFAELAVYRPSAVELRLDKVALAASLKK
jgi:hypothetical protein